MCTWYFYFSNLPYFNKDLIGNKQQNMPEKIKWLSWPTDRPHHYRRAATINWFTETDWFMDKRVLSDKESIGDIPWFLDLTVAGLG